MLGNEMTFRCAKAMYERKVDGRAEARSLAHTARDHLPKECGVVTPTHIRMGV